MGLSPEREQEYIKAELEKLREELEYAAEYGEKSFSVKKIENAIASYQDRLNKLNDAQVKDDFIDFEKLGFDKLFIDECHMYKNLATATKMHNVSGLGSGGAARSFNLLMKSKYMDEITGGKGQTYASGTPISKGALTDRRRKGYGSQIPSATMKALPGSLITGAARISRGLFQCHFQGTG